MAQPNQGVLKLKKEIEKAFSDCIEIFPTFNTIRKIDVIPSRSAIINLVTGIGGFPRGRMVEVFGGWSTGKTTFAIDAVASLQKANPDAVCLYLDYEHAMDARYAHTLGVDLDPNRFVLAQPETFEQGAQISDAFVADDLVDLIVIDSAAAMTPKDELEGKADGTTRIGLQAQLMAKYLSRMTKKIARGRKPALVILNQTRTKIDITNPRNTGIDAAGGNALKFYSSIRLSLEISRKEGEGERGKKVVDQVYTQNRVRVTAVKNKMAPPFIRATLVIEYGRGIDNLASVAELAEAKLGIMSGAGFFNFKSQVNPGNSFTCRGREAFLEQLKSHPATLQELEALVLETLKQEHAKDLGITSLGTEEAKAYEEPTIVLGEEDSGLNSGGLNVTDG